LKRQANKVIIREKDRETICRILDECITGLFEVWAYGSRVNGGAHDGSDIDLVIRGKDLQKIDISEMALLKEKIEESNVPVLVEIRDWARLPESFHTEILAGYEIFYYRAQL